MCWHMMFLSLLLASASLPSVLCRPSLRSSALPQRDESLVHPIRLRHYESAIGLQRRAQDDFSQLDPAEQAQLIYGRPSDADKVEYAKMNLHADGIPIILLERFDDLTSNVDCKGDDGSMSLTFTSKEAYNHALQIWGAINGDDAKQFLVIANHEGCGPDDQRQPYKVSKVDQDSADRTIRMQSEIANWENHVGTYELQFGQLQESHKLKPRDFWDDIKSIGSKVVDAAKGSADGDKETSFDLNLGKKGEKTNIYHDDDGHFSLDCANCYIESKWQLKGYVAIEKYKLKELTVELSPENFTALLELEATLKANGSIEHEEEMKSGPVPYAGYTAPEGIFKIGLTESWNIGVSGSFEGKATANFGVEGKIPKDAKVFADVMDPSNSAAPNWNESTLEPFFDIKELEASITLAAYSNTKLTLGTQFMGLGRVEVSLVQTQPEISTTLTASYDENGVCDSGSSKTGVKMTSHKIETLSLEFQMDFDIDDHKPEKSWTLTRETEPLPEKCFDLKIPGLGPDDPVTTASAAPTMPAMIASAPMATGTGLDIAPMASGTGAVSRRNLMPRTTQPKVCKPPGKTGVCQSKVKYCPGGSYLLGYCPGAGEACCPDPSSWR